MIRSGLIFALLAGCAQASRRSQRVSRAVHEIPGNFTAWECGNCTETCGYDGQRTCVRECVDLEHGSGEGELNAWIDDPYADEYNKQLGDEYDIVCEDDQWGQALEMVDNCPDNDPCPIGAIGPTMAVPLLAVSTLPRFRPENVSSAMLSLIILFARLATRHKK